MKTVITYGTFDLFHVGHVRLFRRLSALGDRLIVGCSTDAFNERKGKKSIFSFEDRAEIVASCRYVDQVFPEESWEQKASDIKRFSADIFAMGDDWAGKFDHLERETGCQVTYVPRTEGISTTDVKAVLTSLRAESLHGILHTIESLHLQVEELGASLNSVK
jgi:glycerol-3-phosphate cytidylyltransferase